MKVAIDQEPRHFESKWDPSQRNGDLASPMRLMQGHEMGAGHQASKKNLPHVDHQTSKTHGAQRQAARRPACFGRCPSSWPKIVASVDAGLYKIRRGVMQLIEKENLALAAQLWYEHVLLDPQNYPWNRRVSKVYGPPWSHKFGCNTIGLGFDRGQEINLKSGSHNSIDIGKSKIPRN